MEQDFGSQCSSGCESGGWTFYLQGHSIMYPCNEKSKNDDDDDDLSMVSDASSGPPHNAALLLHPHPECQNDDTCSAFNESNKEKITAKEARKIQDLTCYFDDTTATSPFFNLSHTGDNQDIVEGGDKVIVDYSKDHHTMKSKSRLQDQYGLFDSSVSAT